MKLCLLLITSAFIASPLLASADCNIIINGQAVERLDVSANLDADYNGPNVPIYNKKIDGVTYEVTLVNRESIAAPFTMGIMSITAWRSDNSCLAKTGDLKTADNWGVNEAQLTVNYRGKTSQVVCEGGNYGSN
jgi:hypothetical protein